MQTITLASLVGSSAAFFDPSQIEQMLPKNLNQAPQCQPVTCGEGEVAVQNFTEESAVKHHGCDLGKILDDVGLGQLNTYSMGMLKSAKLESCCAKYAACQASCGMSMDTCWSRYQACATKACGTADMFCPAVRSFTQIIKDIPSKTDANMDINQARCANYDAAQKSNCKCVPKEDRMAELEKAVVGVYHKAGQKDEISGDGSDLESNFSKKMAALRERWLDAGNDAELFAALFSKFEKRIVKKTKRNPIELKDIPGLAKVMRMPYVRMAIKQFDIDLSEFGINLDDFEVDEPEQEEEEEEVDDAEL